MYVLAIRYNIALAPPAGRNKNRAADVFPISMIGLLGDNWELNWITDAFLQGKVGHCSCYCSMLHQICEELIWVLLDNQKFWANNKIQAKNLSCWCASRHFCTENWISFLLFRISFFSFSLYLILFYFQMNDTSHFWDSIQKSITVFAKKIWYLRYHSDRIASHLYLLKMMEERIISLSATMNDAWFVS